MEHSNRSIRGLAPVYDNDGEYKILKSKVQKEDLYMDGVKKSMAVEAAPAPTYDAAKIAAIIQAFLDA